MRKSKWLWPIFVVLLFSLSLSFFRVKKITCFVDQVQNEEACSRFQFHLGKSLFFHDFLSEGVLLVESEAQNQFDAYYLQNVTKKLPGTIFFYLTTQQPLYRLRIQEKSYLVNEDGKKNEDRPGAEMPLVLMGNDWISQNEEPDSGKVSVGSQAFLRTLFTEAGANSISIREVHLLNNTDVEIITEQNMKVIIEKNAQIEGEMKRLQIILSNIDFDSFEKKIHTIDMRFDFPVLKE